jgi:assimilatory nitrate reductase electron transfer subunit
VSTSAPLRITLIGFGPVGARFAEEILPAVAAGRIALTVVGAESGAPYNRVRIAEYAVGAAEREDLDLIDVDALTAAGVVVRTDAQATRIDRSGRCVELRDGTRLPYDRVVLATGARARVPQLDGLERPSSDGHDESLFTHETDASLTAGVQVLRDLEDARALRSVVAAGGRVVVLGAGVLGIELALMLAKAGSAATVAHFGPAPMPRQLDRGAAWVLSASLADSGIQVVPHTRAEAIVTRVGVDGVRRFHALVSSDGKRIEGDLLLLSCGVTARIDLATDAGLRTDAGVLVDDELRSWSDPTVYAIGDCAHIADPTQHLHDARVPGGPSGLIGPGWRQAEWLARALIAEVDRKTIAPFDDELPAMVVLKSEGVELVSAGEVAPEPFTPVPRGEVAPSVAVWADAEHGAYTKMVTRDGVLTGFVSVGMPRTAAELGVLYARRAELPSDRSLLLRLDAADQGAPSITGPEATVCVCNAVTAGVIEAAILDGCSSVAEVGRCTRAGTGCGSCRSRIADMIEASGSLETAHS